MKRSKRGNIIILFLVLAAYTAFILYVSLRSDHTDATNEYPETEMIASAPGEKGVFGRSDMAMKYKDMPEDSAHQRVLASYYQNRAYPGAPPVIPHPLLGEGTEVGGKGCLQCHENGGYVDRFEAYAPVTPHPELLSCRQCHVPSQTKDLFRESKFKAAVAPGRKNIAMEGAPPVIPHKINMRESCLSCHAGPSAPQEIKVSHPERVNCRQCHVPSSTPEEFERHQELSRDFDKLNQGGNND